jgi:hypothetical protein
MPDLVAGFSVSSLDMYQDVAESLPAEPGDLVRRFSDAKGNVFTSPGDAARSVYQSSSGLHWLETDGLDDVMQLGSPLAAMSSFTIVMGLRLDAAASGASGILSGGTFTSAVGANNNDTFRCNFGYGYNTASVTPGADFVGTVVLEAGVGSRCRVNQGAFDAAAGSGASIAFEFLFARNASASFFQGRGYFLAAYSRVLSSDELDFVERSAADEMGVSL